VINSTMGDQQQPRQPKDLKGLLKFCLEATKTEDAPSIPSDPAAHLAAMEPERRQWLEEAINNMSVDMVQQLGNGIKVLLDPEADLDNKEEVLDCLEDWLGTIDMSCNFHKIGGFVALKQCLASPHPSLRSGAAHLVGEVSQNNPYCQDKLLEEGFLELLLQQLDTDSDPHCQVKALYAISCLAREHREGLAKLSQLDGWSVLVRAVQREDPKLRTKGCFLISSAAMVDSKVVEEMVNMGLVLQLAHILGAPHELSHEHVLNTLLTLVRGSNQARDEARAVTGLLDCLEQRVKEVGGKEEGEEAVQYCHQLLALLKLEEDLDS